MSTVTIGSTSGGWRFTIPGLTTVEVLGIDDRVVATVAVETVAIGRRVRHLGEPHRVIEIRDNGTVRRLIHRTPGNHP